MPDKNKKPPGDKAYFKAAKRNILRKNVNESQEAILRKYGDIPTMTEANYRSQGINYRTGDSISTQKRNIKTQKEKLAYLEGTKRGEKLQKIQKRRGEASTELEYNPEVIRRRINEAQERIDAQKSTFKDGAYTKIKGLYNRG
jgi:hypothetical protein